MSLPALFTSTLTSAVASAVTSMAASALAPVVTPMFTLTESTPAAVAGTARETLVLVSALTASLSAGMTHAADAAAALLDALLRASLQGGLVIALVWALCRLAPRMPAGLRAGLWWLASLKLLVTLAWIQPVALPLLPATMTGGPVASEASAAAGSVSRDATDADARGAATNLRTTAAGPAAAGLVAPPAVSLSASAASRGDGAALRAGDTAPLASSMWSAALGTWTRAWRVLRGWQGFGATSYALLLSHDDTPHSGDLARADGAGGGSARTALWAIVLPVALAGAWLAMVVWRAGRLVRDRRRVRGIVERSMAAPAELAALFDEVCARVAPRQRPVLRVSSEVHAPQVCGSRTPVILLPAHALRQLSPDEWSMTLCHELTHVTRGDLWLGWIPALAQDLFAFHPLAALAAREYSLAREAACDAAVIQHFDAAPQDYGQLLLTLGVAAPLPLGGARLAATCSASSTRNLKRRLHMLQHLPIRPGRSVRWWLLAAIVVAGLIPVRLVAQRAASPARDANEVARLAPGIAGGVQGGVQGGVAAGVAGGIGGGVAGGVASGEAAGVAGGVASGVTSGVDAGAIGGVTSGASAGVAGGVTGGVGAGATSGVSSGAGSGVGSGIGGGVGSGIGSGMGAGQGAGVGAGNGVGAAFDSVRSTLDSLVSSAMDYVDEATMRRWVFIRNARSVSMSGTTGDVARARSYQSNPDEPLLWFRRDGQDYIVRDPAFLAQLSEVFQPMDELGQKQGQLGDRQGELGDRQGKLGEEQGRLGAQQGELGAKQGQAAVQMNRAVAMQLRASADAMEKQDTQNAAQRQRQQEADRAVAAAERLQDEMSRMQEALGRQQEALGVKQEELGKQQEALGRQQEEFGRLQEEAGRRAERAIRELTDKAIATGLAQKVR
jgi:beta-lactamase regulating signal transducer with metallopeptidase domain